MNENDKKNEAKLKKIETTLREVEEMITKKINSLANRINCELKETLDLQTEATSYRQFLVDERTKMYYKMYRELPKLKKMKKYYFESYSTKYPIKINSTEKAKLIEADVVFIETKLEYYQNTINFLTESIKTVDHVIYSVKNKIELYNATGIE